MPRAYAEDQLVEQPAIGLFWIAVTPTKNLSPSQGLKYFGRLTQGVALGYHLSGLQPF